MDMQTTNEIDQAQERLHRLRQETGIQEAAGFRDNIAATIERLAARTIVSNQSSRRVFGRNPSSATGHTKRERKHKCGKCDGLGVVYVHVAADGQYLPYKIGSTEPSFAIPCQCAKLKLAHGFRGGIPAAYRTANLARLKADVSRHPIQAEIVPHLKSHPDDSYIFCGKNRTGKSHFAWVLARHALLSGRRVVATNLSDLMDEYRALERPLQEGEIAPRRPRVISSDLEARGVRYCLLLQEFCKARPSVYASEKLFSLIDAAFNHKHQIIVTSNLPVDRLADLWSEQGSRYGDGIMSRIIEVSTEVRLF
jgi:hypothetical protein